MTGKRTPREEFDLYLHQIRKGEFIPTFEKNARDLAQQQGFPLEEVDKVLPIGYRAEFDRLLMNIRCGDISIFDIQKAKEYAQQHGFPLEEVDKTEPIGARTKFNRYLDRIRKEGQTKFIEDAYFLVEKYGLPIRELDRAVEILRRKETRPRLTYGIN